MEEHAPVVRVEAVVGEELEAGLGPGEVLLQRLGGGGGGDDGGGYNACRVCSARLRRTCFASTVLYSVSNIHAMRPCAHTLLSESTTLLQVGVCLATGKG